MELLPITKSLPLHYLFPLFFIIFAILIMWQSRMMLKHFIIEYSSYLNGLYDTTTTQLKSPLAKTQRYNLIKSLKNMKKYLGISVLLFVIAVIITAGMIVYDSRDYFKEVFEIERNSLNLRSEASADSLTKIIIINQRMLDSIHVELKSCSEKTGILITKDQENRQTIVNLQNVIKHQNTMIDNLKVNR
jgi:hypothetical protein